MFRTLWRRLVGSTASTGRKATCRPCVEVLEDRTVPTLLGKQLFPLSNPWNEKITNAPVAANSDAFFANLVAEHGDYNVRADFAQADLSNRPLYGIPYNVVHGNTTAKIQVIIDDYAAESDIVKAPIPANAVLEGDNQDGPLVGLANRGDSHLIVWDIDRNIAYEFFGASRPSENADGMWHAKQETVWDMKTNKYRTIGYTSADAAGLSILAGLARPDEGIPKLAGGQGVIKHAIRVTLTNDLIRDQFIFPASHHANPGNHDPLTQIPMGARLRLKASVDLSQMPPQSRIIAQAMKDYGLIVADNGANFFISGASYSVNGKNQFQRTWDDNDIQDDIVGLKSLHYGDFEVVDLTPQVRALSVRRATAGTAVTISGLNFSGHAGQLFVYFDSVRASSVRYVSDTQIVVVVPKGILGTVHVRVQSGKSVSSSIDEFLPDGIFGNGISAITPADLFTIEPSAGLFGRGGI
ncbi:MAG: IPT/TIG domain-containing protein [Planctomycetes bacterium]|nr:IPT/TIG domain-containing protein [Planctomycetota bacterium]